MRKEEIYSKYSKKFGVKNVVKGRRNRFSDIIANRTFDETYKTYYRNINASEEEIKNLILAEIKTEFTGFFAIIQWLIWIHKIIIFIEFVLSELKKES